MTLLTQVENENRMAAQGVVRTQASMANAESSGNGDRNPYAQQIYKQFVEPLKTDIENSLAGTGAARRQAHVVLLRSLDPWAVAYIATRVSLSAVLADEQNTRGLGYAIGRAIHTELYLSQFEALQPDLYFALANDLGRRKSKSIEHKYKVYRDQAKKVGLPIVEWDNNSRHQVGLYLLDRLRVHQMFIVGSQVVNGAGPRAPVSVHLHPDVQDTIQHIKGFFALTQPVMAPCVELPHDWTSWDNGGFHTTKMRRAQPFLVKAPAPARSRMAEHEMPKVLKAVNALQRTAWQVNGPILDVVMEIAQRQNLGEILTDADVAKPIRPDWLDGDKKVDDFTEVEMSEFVQWKRETAQWHTDRKLASAKKGRFYTATRAAQEYRDYPNLYFVYYADFRGRLYPQTYGISPQGSDIQKALLRFAVGKPITNQVAEDWFMINGANRWGFDKATLAERAAWHKDKKELLFSFAQDPVNNQGWAEADKPLQFLAWCMEYAEYYLDPKGFLSHIPVGMDGSCNGLQNLSAMLRDEVGGKATNLTANVVMEDIYKQVADATTIRMTHCTLPDEFQHKAKWLAHGINRSVVKRAVMTTPYGVTRQSATAYVIEDYIKPGKVTVFEKEGHNKAAACLMNYAWPAIGDVVIKAREAMVWLTKSARTIIKENVDEEGKEKDEGTIAWVTPSGFLACQAYYNESRQDIRTQMFGHARVLVEYEKADATASRSDHASGLAPNFVHSMDASHLHLTTVAMVDKVEGVSLAMIHDDYGTHAADAQVLFNTIREEFVSMYEHHDPLQEFRNRYPMCSPIPSKGTLNIREVLDSDFFFS